MNFIPLNGIADKRANACLRWREMMSLVSCVVNGIDKVRQRSYHYSPRADRFRVSSGG